MDGFGSRSSTSWPGSVGREPSRRNKTRSSRLLWVAAMCRSQRTRENKYTHQWASSPLTVGRSSGMSAHTR
jgi:hypothetical protein